MLDAIEHAKMSRYFRSQGPFMLYCVVISVIAFGFELTNVSISVDEEIASLLVSVHPGWIGADRWAMALLNFIFQPGPTLPYYPMVLAMTFNFMSLLITLRLWKGEEGLAKYLVAVVILTMPTIAFIYQFNLCSYGYYFGLLCTVIATYFFVKNSHWKTRLFIIALLTFAIATYQATLFVAPTIFFIHLFINYKSEFAFDQKELKLLGRKIASFSLILLSSIVLHQIISNLIRRLQDINVRYHTVRNFFDGSFISRYDISFTIKEIIAFISGYKLYIGWFNGILVVLAIGVTSYFIYKTVTSGVQKIILLGILGAAISSAFALVIVTGHIWPARAMMAVPFLYGGLVFIAYRISVPSIKYCLIVVCVLAGISNLYMNTRLFYSDHLAWQRDSDLAKGIAERAELLYGDSIVGVETPLVVIGKQKNKTIPAQIKFETFGQYLAAPLDFQFKVAQGVIAIHGH